jgi:putative endonuclease
MGSRRLGALGEELAVRHLERAGMVVLARNWRCADGPVRGEIDVVAWDDPAVVFCEVKARRGVAAGHPLEAVTPAKVAQLRRLAGRWLARSELRAPPVRFDVVAVCWPAQGGRARITHLRGIG